MAWAHLTVTQHVLIKKIFGIFAVSCTVHVSFIYFATPPPPSSTSNRTGLGLALGLPRPIIDISKGEKKKETFHLPEPMVYFRFSRKKNK